MSDTLYDTISDYYLSFVQNGLEDASSVFHLGKNAILDLTGEVRGKDVCDLACGEGYFSRALAGHGATLTGVDTSKVLLNNARQQAGTLAITYIQDDAQTLAKLADASFDSVVCNMALMDIPDIDKTFTAVHRVLRPDGCFAFAILHPCFETPFRVPESPIEVDEHGEFVAIRGMHYLEEGYWNSGGDGMRGRVGAYHRTLSAYVNTLLATGFRIAGMSEPALPRGDYHDLGRQKGSRIPSLLAIKGFL